MEKLQGFDQNLAPQDLQIQLTKTESCILVFFWVFFLTSQVSPGHFSLRNVFMKATLVPNDFKNLLCVLFPKHGLSFKLCV